MRILFAGLTSPYPPTNGHRLRTWALVRALADEGHKVTVVALADSEEPLGDLSPLQRITETLEVVPAPRRVTQGRDSVKRLRTLLSPTPFNVWKFRSSAFTQALERHLRRAPHDLLICDGVYNLQNMPAGLTIPVLLNKDDVAHVILERYLAVERNPARRLYGLAEAWKVRRWERGVRAVAGIWHAPRSTAPSSRRSVPTYRSSSFPTLSTRSTTRQRSHR